MTESGKDTQPPYVGRGVVGRNNAILAAGRGTFVDDVHAHGCLVLRVVRSPHAAARIRATDLSAARAVPGVVLVADGAEMVRAGLVVRPGGVFDFFEVRQSDRYPLAVDTVRYVGEPVVVVVAENAHAARSACRVVVVDYEPLHPVLGIEAALEPDARVIEDGWPDNLMIDWAFGDGDTTSTALADAERRSAGTLTCGRIAATPLEPRGTLTDWNKWNETLTVHASTQGPHVLRTMLAGVLGLDDSQVRVIQPHVGGAFGSKIPIFPEDVLAAWASIRLERPVRFIEERDESLMAGGHARDIACRYDVGYSSDGRLLALEVTLDADLGAPSTFAGFLMAIVTAGCIPGSYQVPAVRVTLRGAVTNRGPWQAYRGYGKEAATFFMERILDEVARGSGSSRADVRRRNFVRPDQFPYNLASGWTMDSGNYQPTLDLALELVGADTFEERRAEAAAQGRVIGLGFAHELTPEGSARPGSLLGGTDSSTVRMSPRGQVTLLTGVTSPGGGNETRPGTDGCRRAGSRARLCPRGAGRHRVVPSWQWQLQLAQPHDRRCLRAAGSR